MNVPGIAPPAFMIPKTDPACEGAMSCGFATMPKVCIPVPNMQNAINKSAGIKDLVWPTNNFNGCRAKMRIKLEAGERKLVVRDLQIKLFNLKRTEKTDLCHASSIYAATKRKGKIKKGLKE